MQAKLTSKKPMCDQLAPASFFAHPESACGYGLIPVHPSRGLENGAFFQRRSRPTQRKLVMLTRGPSVVTYSGMWRRLEVRAAGMAGAEAVRFSWRMPISRG